METPKIQASPPDKLCQACTKLDLQRENFIISSVERYKQLTASDRPYEPSYNLGRRVQIRERVTCPLCRAVSKVLDMSSPRFNPPRGTASDQACNAAAEEKLLFVIGWSRVHVFATDPFKGSRHLEIQCRLPVPQGIESWRLISTFPNIFNWRSKLHLVAQDNDIRNEGQPAIGRVVSSERIQTSDLRKWLEKCRTRHGKKCHSSLSTMLGPKGHFTASWFWLIDVEQLCLVKPVDVYVYVALSYVWGGSHSIEFRSSNETILQQPDSLSNCSPGMPLVIQDAIAVTKDMGFRYLWIDRLCVMQDESPEKQKAINSMHYVYNGAEFTIVAAAGADADVGLLGWRPHSRGWQQVVEEIGPEISVCSCREADQSFLDSTFQTRAWTFQEYCFSKRKIIFTDGTVMFVCQQCRWLEDTTLEGGDGHQEFGSFTSEENRKAPSYALETKLLQQGTWALSSEERLDEELANSFDPLFNSFKVLLSGYSTRELSFQSDALNAFQGIAMAWAQRMKSDLFFGMPLLFFDWFMLFRAATSRGLYPRDAFPSWSWAGWQGPIELKDLSTDTFMDFNVNHVLTRWVYYDVAGQRPRYLHRHVPEEGDNYLASGKPYVDYSSRGRRYASAMAASALGAFQPRNLNLNDVTQFPLMNSSIGLRAQIVTWAVCAKFVAASNMYWGNESTPPVSRKQPESNGSRILRDPERPSWAFFDRNDIWAGNFDFHDIWADEAGGEFEVDVILLSTGKSFDTTIDISAAEQARTESDFELGRLSYDYREQILRPKGLLLPEDRRYNLDEAENTFQTLLKSIINLDATMLDRSQFPMRDMAKQLFYAAKTPWQVANVMAIRPVPTAGIRSGSVPHQSIGTGWVFKTALANALDLGLTWRHIALI